MKTSAVSFLDAPARASSVATSASVCFGQTLR